MHSRDHRDRPEEKERIADLMKLIPENASTALDIGARDGFIANLLTEYFDEVIALDLEMPEFDIPKVTKVKGDVTKLEFSDNHVDVIVCAEVLEHIPGQYLQAACKELSHVAKMQVIVGVPYKQDIRSDKTTCAACGAINPPWGHVNTFDESALQQLFPNMECVAATHIGSIVDQTNALSSWLMTLAGNPWGSYEQDEVCVSCGKKLLRPASRNIFQKVITKLAVILTRIQRKFVSPHPIWVHMVFEKSS